MGNDIEKQDYKIQLRIERSNLGMKNGMRVFNEGGDVIAVFYSVRRDGDKLVVDGKALETMRMDMIFKAEEVLKGLRLVLSWQAVSFVDRKSVV